MTSARQNRGTGNGGAKYRESSFWDAIEAKKRQCDCDGCKLTKNPKCGYQPCHKNTSGGVNPPGRD